MASVVRSKKSCAVDPLKTSQTIGAALAFLGVDRCLPMLHGSQGCTSFGLVLFVRHFRETIPMQTTAMSEVNAILGGEENVEKGLLTLMEKANPDVIGLCSTALTETSGVDLGKIVRDFLQAHPDFPAAVVPVVVPDFAGALPDGWATAVTRVIEELVAPAEQGGAGREPGCPAEPRARRVNLLPGSHLTPAEVEALADLARAFGLEPIVLPDLSGSLDGHVPETFLPHTLGGTPRAAIRDMASSALTIAVGEHMRGPAQALATRSGVPFEVLDGVMGLAATDRLVGLLSRISGNPVPSRLRRERARLQDAMLDAHFFTGGRRVAIGADPDLLFALASTLSDVGCEIAAAVTTTSSPVLERVPVDEVVVGDLEDLEARARGCDLLVTHSHGRAASERLGIPLLRAGIPSFDRLGGPQAVWVGYSGTATLLFEVANAFLAAGEAHTPGERPLSRGGTKPAVEVFG
jgi:nitrogenase molybdenum-iron protein NifN